jgi:hypothetical protein
MYVTGYGWSVCTCKQCGVKSVSEYSEEDDTTVKNITDYEKDGWYFKTRPARLFAPIGSVVFEAWCSKCKSEVAV